MSRSKCYLPNETRPLAGLDRDRRSPSVCGRRGGRCGCANQGQDRGVKQRRNLQLPPIGLSPSIRTLISGLSVPPKNRCSPARARSDARRSIGKSRNSASLIAVADGSVVRADSNKETITLPCIEPGHRDVGINAVPIASSQEREVDLRPRRSDRPQSASHRFDFKRRRARPRRADRQCR